MGNLSALVDTVENAYDAAAPDPEWLRSVIQNVAPELDRGLGLLGWFYDVSNPADIRLMHPTTHGAPDDAIEAVFASVSHPAMTLDIIQEHWATPAGTSRAQVGADPSTFTPFVDTIYRLGIQDIVTINAHDADGRGLAVNALCPEPQQLDRRYVEQLERVSAHLIASYRLRRRGPLGTQQAQAILSPEGAVLHAEGEAKNNLGALSDAAKCLQQVRGSMRWVDPESALLAWKALVEARWSVVDFVDSDGKRLLVARVNEPLPKEHPKLSLRQRQIASMAARGHSNKLIAYDLGVAEGTVAAHLASAIKKLGLSSRQSLLALFAHEGEG